MMCTRLLMAVFVLAALAPPVAAQTQITTGVIQGTVVDASGAVLPGVDVEVRNVDTNLTRTVVTDRDGRFVVLQLPPGRYTVTFKLSGFATLVQENVAVTVGQAVRLNADDEGLGRGGDGDGHDAGADGGHRRARRSASTLERDDDRHDADPRAASSRTC